jgi:hypothetical protein
LPRRAGVQRPGSGDASSDEDQAAREVQTDFCAEHVYADDATRLGALDEHLDLLPARHPPTPQLPELLHESLP